MDRPRCLWGKFREVHFEIVLGPFWGVNWSGFGILRAVFLGFLGLAFWIPFGLTSETHLWIMHDAHRTAPSFVFFGSFLHSLFTAWGLYFVAILGGVGHMFHRHTHNQPQKMRQPEFGTRMWQFTTGLSCLPHAVRQCVVIVSLLAEGSPGGMI